jgi:hypothetical protein
VTSLLTALLIMVSPAPAPAANTPVSPAVASAEQWVGLVDRGLYRDSWEQAGAMLKAQIGKPGWAAAVEPVRKPLGAVVSRKLRSETPTRTLPGVPDGDYDVLEFETDFAGSHKTTETIFLAREASGWKVDGYFVKPAGS